MTKRASREAAGRREHAQSRALPRHRADHRLPRRFARAVSAARARAARRTRSTRRRTCTQTAASSLTAPCPCRCGEHAPIAGSSAHLGVALPSTAPDLAPRLAAKLARFAPVRARSFARDPDRSRSRFRSRRRDPRWTKACAPAVRGGARALARALSVPKPEDDFMRSRSLACAVACAAVAFAFISFVHVVPARACSICQAGDPLFSSNGATAQEQGTVSAYARGDGLAQDQRPPPRGGRRRARAGPRGEREPAAHALPGLDPARPSDPHARGAVALQPDHARSPTASRGKART